MEKAIKNPAIQPLHQKFNLSQWEASSSANQSNHPGTAEKSKGCRVSPVVINLPREAAVLTYHRRELAVLSKLWRETAGLAYHRRELEVT
jgi:hypothetical protein